MARRTFRSIVVGALVAGAVVAGAVFPLSLPARAEAVLTAAADKDKITLKNGKVLEGRITREVEDIVWFTEEIGTVENQLVLKLADVAKIERASHSAKAGGEPAVKPADRPAGKARGAGGAPRAAVLTLEGEVGTQFCAKPLMDAIPLLEKEGVDIVVLKVNSGGGSVAEMKIISDVIQREYKPRFTTVAWIESAISAAAAGVHCLEDIYFMANGNYGACTGFRMKEKAEAVKGRELEELLLWGEKVSGYGRHPKEIFRAMQISGDEAVVQELQISPPSGILSADITEAGDVIWHQDTTGKYLLNPQGTLKILTFNSEQAVKFKFARAIANDLQELGTAMGYQEIEWVGKQRKGQLFPVSEAEDLQQKWRAKTTELEYNMGVYINEYARQLESARGAQDRQDRGIWINKATQSLANLRRLVKDYPNFKNSIGLNKDWFEEQDEIIRKLKK